MRTWKQGAIGKIHIDDGSIVYTKCLKYPLLTIYESFDTKKCVLEKKILSVFVDLDVLKRIEKIMNSTLTKEEKELALSFDVEFISDTSVVGKIEPNKTKQNDRVNYINAIGIAKWKNISELIYQKLRETNINRN
jgi:hypothetical protein